MRILLIQPAKAPVTIGGEDINIFEPLALEYVAAGVMPDHDVRILDMRFGEDLREVLSEFNPHIVGITSYTVNVNVVQDLFRKIKAFSPEILTVVGGHHATVSPGDFMSPFIDLIVMGEGVSAFREIVRRFESKEGFEGIRGAVYEKEGKMLGTPPENVVDLDSLPFPERSGGPSRAA